MPLTGDYAELAAGWVRDQLEAIDAAGNDTRAVSIMDRPVVVLTIRGAKSGKLRRTPLMRVEHNGEYAAVASAGGAPKHPDWYHNLKANPHIELRDGTTSTDMVATEIDGAEREQWWQRCVEAFPPYAKYQGRAGRQIPVFVCRPLNSSGLG
ncbi:MAG: nitroreductase [Micrococcales bacterium]|nr:MAG: nitroreductase [Micrococcales bacterium]PIE27530.1 MAG: nitroreductase [Micrococcales bacterium]